MRFWTENGSYCDCFSTKVFLQKRSKLLELTLGGQDAPAVNLGSLVLIQKRTWCQVESPFQCQLRSWTQPVPILSPLQGFLADGLLASDAVFTGVY